MSFMTESSGRRGTLTILTSLLRSLYRKGVRVLVTKNGNDIDLDNAYALGKLVRVVRNFENKRDGQCRKFQDPRGQKVGTA